MNFNVDWGELSKNCNFSVEEKKTYGEDKRFWKLSTDENGKGAAIIRLLPDKNEVPYIRILNCGLKEFNAFDKKYYWYIRDLPSSIKEKDPLNELWSALYNYGGPGREEAKNFSRREVFITNVLVVKDPSNPENNGKIFLWKFGKKLLEKFLSALNPSEQERELGEKPKPLFHPLLGSNIALKIKKVAGFPNYDDTTIASPSKVFETEEEAIETIQNNSHELNEFLSKDYYDSYEDLRDSLLKFCRKYTPKHMSQEEFDKIVADTFSIEIGKSYTPKVSVVETPKEEKKVEKEVKESKKETKKVENDDDIDALLEDLDI